MSEEKQPLTDQAKMSYDSLPDDLKSHVSWDDYLLTYKTETIRNDLYRQRKILSKNDLLKTVYEVSPEMKQFQQSPTKTLAECKDEVGKEHGFPLNMILGSTTDDKLRNIVTMVEEANKRFYNQNKRFGKTLLDFKNDLSYSHGYKSYQHFMDNPNKEHDDWDFHAELLDESAELYASQTQPAQSLIDDLRKIVSVEGDIMDIRIHVGKVYGTNTSTDELLHALEMKIFKMLDKYSTPTDHDGE